MPIVAAAIMPHGSEAITALHAPQWPKFESTARGLEEAAQRLTSYPATVAVVLTPHGIRAEGMMTISTSENLLGIIEEGEVRLEERFPVHQDIARHVAEASRAEGISVAQIAYGASSGPDSCLPMDWGAQVPLHFLQQTTPALQAVVITPSRALPLDALHTFGRVIRETLDKHPEPIWLIASADLAHAHQEEGPYGYDPAADEFDAWFVDVIRTQRLQDLLSVDMAWVERAKPDALWQAVILSGAVGDDWMGHVIRYDCPTYFGMMSAVYTPSPGETR